MDVNGEKMIMWGALAGIIGAVAFSTLWSLAIITDGHWIFGVETLSELGGHRPGRCFFNTGLIVMGLLSLPFGAVLYRKFEHIALGKISTGAFVLAAISLVGIGVFPINTGTPHTFFSWVFFSTVIISQTIMLRPIWMSPRLGRPALVVTLGTVMVGYITIILVATKNMELALS
ncbi:MAG: DUF998 domain-containing protein [Methanomassiliicoccus sp.]|nr:MAG: DUF998 domain-containing protein [Methanomassiliicoccus sp.]